MNDKKITLVMTLAEWNAFQKDQRRSEERKQARGDKEVKKSREAQELDEDLDEDSEFA